LKNLKLIVIGFAVTYIAYLILSNSSLYSRATSWHFDKIFHIAGGYLAAALAVSFFGTVRWWTLCLFSLLLGIGWEVSESFLLRPWATHGIYLISSMLISWSDIVADMIGAFLYWLICRGSLELRKNPKNAILYQRLEN